MPSCTSRAGPRVRGWGRSKKQAEQAAARAAWEDLIEGAGRDAPDGLDGS